MDELIDVFQFNLGALDVLINTKDFSGLASWIDCKTHTENNLDTMFMDYPQTVFSVEIKNTKYTGFFIDSLFNKLFGTQIPTEYPGFCAFMCSCQKEIPFALFTTRNFEMHTYNMYEFQKFPYCVRDFFAKHGCEYVHFDKHKKMQILINSKSIVSKQLL